MTCSCGQSWPLSRRHFPFYCTCGQRHESPESMQTAGEINEAPRPPRVPGLTRAETSDLFRGEADDPALLGNRIAALTSAIGLPPCGGCEVRKAWLNKAHAWVRSLLR